MRYVAVTAAVFGGAMFMAPGSPASPIDASTTNPVFNDVKSIAHIGSAPQQLQGNATKPAAKLAADESARPAPVMVTINPGDSLSTIAVAHGSTVQRLYDVNTFIQDPNLIFPGHQLRVPDPDEQLTDRPMPAPAAAVNDSAQSVATPAPASAPVSVPVQVSAPTVAGGSVWDSLAQCESGGNWSINTGNGFYGGLQFTLATWQGLGGSGLPSQASREQQIALAQALQARSGWGQWPACSAKLGLR